MSFLHDLALISFVAVVFAVWIWVKDQENNND